MDRFHLMTVFVAVSEEESFAKAARRLGMSAPAVTRAVTALEEHLAAKLLHRTTRFVRVTEAGQRYLEDARRILAEVEEADEAVAGINAVARGTLSVTASVVFGRLFVLPIVVEYLQRHPATDVSAMLLDRIVNLMEEGFDVGVRIGRLPDSGLRAIPVANVAHVLCAAPAYLERRGTPATPADLASHDIISAAGITPTSEWRFGEGRAAPVVKVAPRLALNNNEAAIDAAIGGLGIVRLLSYQAATHLDSGRLVSLLPEYVRRTIPVNIIHREGRHASAKVRSFIDLAVERLRHHPSLA